jgi:dUTP pyrophosphatase
VAHRVIDDIDLRIRLLRPGAQAPEYKTEHAAGLDLSAAPEDDAPVTLRPRAVRMVPCGFAMALPPGYEAQVRPRSGLASRHAVTLANAPGTIDADYRGEVTVPMINLGEQDFVVEPGMRIAQMIIARVARAQVIPVDDLSELGETARGAGGFGSTGL